MPQKIKVQDGVVIYSAADPTIGISMNVAGSMNISNQLNVGSINSSVSGVLSTPDTTTLSAARLDITTGTNNSLNIYENASGGSLFINGAQWPHSTQSPAPGMFVGSSALNQLTYYSFILGTSSSDSLLPADLNATYPLAQIGQVVVGPTIVYYCIGSGQWRNLGGGSATTIPVLIVALHALAASPPAGVNVTSWSSMIYQQSTETAVTTLTSPYTGVLFTMGPPGIYRITVQGQWLPIGYPTSGSWPTGTSVYGTNIIGSVAGFAQSEYVIGEATTSGWPTGTPARSMIQWSDTFYIENYTANGTFQVALYLNMTSSSDYHFTPNCLVSVERMPGSSADWLQNV